MRCDALNQARIFGGEEAEPHSHPWMIHIKFRAQMYTNGELSKTTSWKLCQGTLVDSKTIVTSADCTNYRWYQNGNSAFWNEYDDWWAFDWVLIPVITKKVNKFYPIIDYCW